MRIIVLAVLLGASGCASGGSGRYLLVTLGSHGAIIWERFSTPEACEQARLEDAQSRRQVGLAVDTRCMTARDLRER